MKPLSVGCQSSWKIDCVVASCSLDLQRKNPETYERYCKVNRALPSRWSWDKVDFKWYSNILHVYILRLVILVKTDISICLNSSIIANVAKQLLMLVLLNHMLKQALFIHAIGSTIILLTIASMTQEQFSNLALVDLIWYCFIRYRM